MKKLYKFRVDDRSKSYWVLFGEAIITVFIQMNDCLNTLFHPNEQKHYHQLSGLRVVTHMVK